MSTSSVANSKALFAAKWISFLMISLLFSFHIFRHQRTKTSSSHKAKLWNILDLRYISFVLLIAYLFRGLIQVGAPTIGLGVDYLNDPICNAILRVSNTMGLIGRFGIHLFVAVRCKLSSYKQQLTIWMKIGFIMLSSDVFITFSVWIYYPQIVPIYDGTSCVIQSYSLIYVFWVILNDIVISIYCIIVFVWPLRKIIYAERAAKAAEVVIDIENDKKKTIKMEDTTERTMEDFVKRIIFCSIVASLGIVISCGIASISFTTKAGPFIVELESFVGCYMIVMQFKDIDPNKVKSKFWSVVVIIFEWDYWCCCNRHNSKRNNIQKAIKLQTRSDECQRREIMTETDNTENKENLDTERCQRATVTATIPTENNMTISIPIPMAMGRIPSNSISSGITPSNSVTAQ